MRHKGRKPLWALEFNCKNRKGLNVSGIGFDFLMTFDGKDVA